MHGGVEIECQHTERERALCTLRMYEFHDKYKHMTWVLTLLLKRMAL